jgi:Cof subfamily protein (haloacid dehalogenase superfamily)
MSVKMVVTDLDGTLLRRDKTISEYTISVFRRCHNEGMKIVYATARPIRAVKRWLNIKIENDACIYHNGAVIEIDGKLFREIGIEHELTSKLLAKAEQLMGMKVAVEINDALYTNFDASIVWPGADVTITDFRNLPKSTADKILFITADRAEIGNIEELLGENLYWEVSENEALMVMNKQARKRNAINEIAKHYGLSITDVVAFGDDYNDIEMLRECGVGVAVANAIIEATDVADYICDDCDNDGVARWLDENVLV